MFVNILCFNYTSECKLTIIGQEYMGTMSFTRSGIKCQHWSSQTPHSHNMQVSYLGTNNDKDHENYCLTSSATYDNAQTPWCYTVNPDIRFQDCHIPYCCMLLYFSSEYDFHSKHDFFIATKDT